MLVAALELASFALYSAATGRRFSYARIAREQAGEIEQAGPRLIGETGPETGGVAPPGQAEEGRPEATPTELVPHPFTGFVYDPEALSRGSHPGAMALTDLGFFRLAAPPGGGEERSVAIFGGSVAVYFSLDGREALMRALAADPALRGGRVRVECFALGGFKQPQMLTALAYLLALGRHFDVVIELDGVNDVVVSLLDYKTRGLFPAYPQDWDRLVGQAADIQEQRLIGKVVYLQGRRGWLAQRFSRRPLSWSITAALVWKSLDRWASADLARARQDLAGASRPGRAYREHGPVRRYASDQELLAETARLWGLSSLQMHRLCAAAGTRYYHFLQPNQYVPGSKPMGAGERAVAYRADHPYRRPIELGYPLLQAEGARLSALGVAFHDLSPVFAGITEPL